MKVYVTKINASNESLIECFKYTGKKSFVADCMWVQLIEPRYILSKKDFESLWLKYSNSNTPICHNDIFYRNVLLTYLDKSNIYLLESFLEKIWINYKFLIYVK